MSETGLLVCDKLDLNLIEDTETLEHLLKVIAKDEKNYRKIVVDGKYYFNLPEQDAPESPGWYIIYALGTPLYVGEATNLNSRLNSKDGSRDNFANPRRKNDPERNFIKRFYTIGLLTDLKVLLIPEDIICKSLGLQIPLSSIDHANLEKFIGIFRSRLV